MDKEVSNIASIKIHRFLLAQSSTPFATPLGTTRRNVLACSTTTGETGSSANTGGEQRNTSKHGATHEFHTEGAKVGVARVGNQYTINRGEDTAIRNSGR